jgi:hypothetical protein
MPIFKKFKTGLQGARVLIAFFATQLTITMACYCQIIKFRKLSTSQTFIASHTQYQKHQGRQVNPDYKKTTFPAAYEEKV